MIVYCIRVVETEDGEKLAFTECNMARDIGEMESMMIDWLSKCFNYKAPRNESDRPYWHQSRVMEWAKSHNLELEYHFNFI